MNWWDHGWNPVGGCSIASTGCRNCYAQKLAATQQTAHLIPLYLGTTNWVKGKPLWNGKLTVLPPGDPGWNWPLTWSGAKYPVLGQGKPSLIFVGDMCDLFHPARDLATIDQVVGTITLSDHIGLLLTRRADVMARYFVDTARTRQTVSRWQRKLWLGFSAERQREFDDRWAYVRRLARRRWTIFVSIAPMLGPVTLPPDFLALGSRAWVICSGEQGPDARIMHPDWARAVRDQCADAGVPFFVLQMTRRRDIPSDLQIRQFPELRGQT